MLRIRGPKNVPDKLTTEAQRTQSFKWMPHCEAALLPWLSVAVY